MISSKIASLEARLARLERASFGSKSASPSFLSPYKGYAPQFGLDAKNPVLAQFVSEFKNILEVKKNEFFMTTDSFEVSFTPRESNNPNAIIMQIAKFDEFGNALSKRMLSFKCDPMTEVVTINGKEYIGPGFAARKIISELR